MDRIVRIMVSGKVQGVYFRKYSVQEACRLKLKGWVKNQADGSVLIEARGEPEDIEAFIKWCHLGSPASKVNSVTVEDIEHLVNLKFSIRY